MSTKQRQQQFTRRCICGCVRCVSVCVSVCLFVCLFVCVSVYVCVCLSFCCNFNFASKKCNSITYTTSPLHKTLRTNLHFHNLHHSADSQILFYFHSLPFRLSLCPSLSFSFSSFAARQSKLVELFCMLHVATTSCTL